MKLTAKEDKIKYINLHRWIRNNYGNAIKCEFCDGLKAKRFEWALKKGCEYKKNINNFIQLCPSCHRKYDETKERRLKISLSKKNKPAKNKKAVIQYNLQQKIINTFSSITKASEKTNISRTSIHNNLNNHSKTSGGFIWKYQQKK